MAAEFAITEHGAPEVQTLEVPDSLGGQRLDLILAQLLPQHSRSRLQAWVRAGQLRVDGSLEQEVKRKLIGGECLQLQLLEEPSTTSPIAEDIPIDVIYADASLLVINKPAGLVVHPGNGNRQGTLLNALLHYAPELQQVPRAGIVHRLDKETSGLLVVARSIEAQTNLVRQLQARSVSRKYLAVAMGEVRTDGQVDAPIARHPVHRTKMAVYRGGKTALTYYRVLERFPAATLLECSLSTGRTHQIRVHMGSLGHPLVGDSVYGKTNAQNFGCPRQALHAWRLALKHPESAQEMAWEARLPRDMEALLERLRATIVPAR